MKKINSLILVFLCFNSAWAQKKYTSRYKDTPEPEQVKAESKLIETHHPLFVVAEAVTQKKSELKYFKNKTTGLILTRTDADICTDGNISTVKDEEKINDKHHQKGLYSQLDLNPYEINYTVLPKEEKILASLEREGVQMRNIYWVYNLKNKKSGFGIVADIGPGGQTTNGEFSIHQIKELGLPVDPETGTGGADANDIVTVIFPYSFDLIKKPDPALITQDRINVLGQELLQQYQEKTQTANFDSLIEMIKSVTTEVKLYD